MDEVPLVKALRSSSGSEIEVDNISRGGALLQTRKRMMPGSRIQLRLVSVAGEMPLTGFVLRSSISSPKGMPRYQTAVVFERPLQVLEGQPWKVIDGPRLSVPRSSSPRMFPSGFDEPLCGPIREGKPSLSAALVAVRAFNAQDAALYQMLKPNDW
jgi:hypothetical protein